MGDTESALREYQEVRETNPNFLPARLHLGVTLYSASRKEEAVAEWRAVLELDPDNKSALMYLKMVATSS